jgi:predicted flap endonuclease-1-like 5' DNA nuclease
VQAILLQLPRGVELVERCGVLAFKRGVPGRSGIDGTPVQVLTNRLRNQSGPVTPGDGGTKLLAKVVVKCDRNAHGHGHDTTNDHTESTIAGRISVSRSQPTAPRPRYRGPMSTRHLPAQVGDLPPIGRPANSALLAAGVTTLAQVATYRRADLLAMHGVGPKAVGILATALAERGLTFAD